MNKNLILELVKAICTRVQEIEGYLNKTKLIKLLYLIDVEHYRKYRQTFTELNWIFYKFGPWAYDYNEIIEEIESSFEFRVDKVGVTEEVSLIHCVSDSINFNTIFSDPDDSRRFREIVERWGREDLNRLLDYVYFRTEPMYDARKGEELDFSKIHTLEPIPAFKLDRGTLSKNQLFELRQKLTDAFKEREKHEELYKAHELVAKYDDVYQAAMDKMDLDSDY